MKTDNITKILLAVIAIAVWTIALNTWRESPPVVRVQPQEEISFDCFGYLAADGPAGYSIELDCD